MHTPGPWVAHPDDQGGAGLAAYVPVDAPESRHVVARVVCYDRATDTLPYQANARLIAAAPDMLAALKNIVHDIRRGNGGNDCLTEAEAVIAKANGTD